MAHSQTPMKRSLFRRFLPLFLTLAALALAGGWVAFVLIPWPGGWATRNPGMTAVMQQRMEEAEGRGELLQLRQEWVPLDRISANLVRAVIVAEDGRFQEHGGVDWLALAEELRWEGRLDGFSIWNAEDRRALRGAIARYRDEGEELRGRSTITQQLAKNLYFGTERSLLRKGIELLVARRLERQLGKDRILELYLNIVELGPGLFGVQAASLEYFGKGADALTLFESATLAAILPHPLTSNPNRSPARMEARRALLLQRLAPGGGGPAPDGAPPIVGPGFPDPAGSVPFVPSISTEVPVPITPPEAPPLEGGASPSP